MTLKFNNQGEVVGTAYHEAGHAVVAIVRGRTPILVTIIPDGPVAGRNEFLEDWLPQFNRYLGESPEKRTYIETRVLIALAGSLAHSLQNPSRILDVGDFSDFKYARDIINERACWAESFRDRYCLRLKIQANRLLKKNWFWVEAVSVALLEKKTLIGEDIERLRPNSEAAQT